MCRTWWGFCLSPNRNHMVIPKYFAILKCHDQSNCRPGTFFPKKKEPLRHIRGKGWDNLIQSPRYYTDIVFEWSVCLLIGPYIVMSQESVYVTNWVIWVNWHLQMKRRSLLLRSIYLIGLVMNENKINVKSLQLHCICNQSTILVLDN